MSNKPIVTSGMNSEKVKNNIAAIVTKYYIIYIAIATIIFSVSIYFYTLSSTKESSRNQLFSFINERGLRESDLFLESDAYQARFQKEYIERYSRTSDLEAMDWFEVHMEKRIEDGTYRSKPELYYGKDMPLGRHDGSASMMIGAQTEITPEVIKALAIGYDMINQYGPAWRKPFVDLYFSSPQKTSVSRWPGTPWGLIMNDSVEWREEEWMAITMKENNPQREQKWSGVLYDERNGNWMVSGVTPIDFEGEQLGMVGTDLLLDDLVKRTYNTGLHGTYNILLQGDGRIIAHPLLVDEIIASKGMLNAKTSSDEFLQHVFEHILDLTNFPYIIDDDHNALIAVTKIHGPDWYFITIYPNKLYMSKAINSAIIILLFGLSFLLIVFITNWLVLKRIIVNPITLLTTIVKNYHTAGNIATQKSTFKEIDSKLIKRHDEIGLLFRSFVKMSDNLQDSINELKQSEARFSAITNQSSEGITVADMEGKYIYVNPTFCSMSGYSKEELLNLTVFDMKAKNQPRKSFYDSKEKLEGLPIRVNLKRKDNTEYLTDIVGKVIRVDDKELVLGTIRDITAIVKAEEELDSYRNHLEEIVKKRTAVIEKQKIQVETANKLKSEFLSNMSHELRTPLNSIMVLSNVLVNQTKDRLDSEEKSWLEIIERNGKQLLALINDILDLSKIEAGKMEIITNYISIDTQLRLVVDNMKSMAEKKNLSLTLNILNSLPQVETDDAKFHQLILNIVSNAVKFTKKGSVDISAKHEADNIIIKIKDSGIGISQEMLPFIFDEFRQVDGTSAREYEGTGLGLAIASKLLKILGGNISVESELGIGTIFTITIPVSWHEESIKANDENSEINSESTKIVEVDQNKVETISEASILVVEDKPDNMTTIKAILKNKYNIMEAVDGEQGLDMIISLLPDLVLLDMSLPKLDGIEILKIVRADEKAKNIPIIAVTAQTMKGDKEKFMDAGCNAYIPKPIDPVELLTEIRKLLNA
ncbi:MAG: ATP-binding protein [Bacteroidota bacterium]